MDYKWAYHGLTSVRIKYSKSYASLANSPFPSQCLAVCEGGESLLVWLVEVV